MPTTYPPPAPVLNSSLTAAEIHYLLRSPTRLARRIRDLSLYRYIADYLLTGRYQAQGGAVLYENGEPIFTNDDPEAIEPGGEYPQTSADDGTLGMAKTTKWGRDQPVTDEAISRQGIDPLNKALRRLVNTNVRYIDSVALGVIASKITRTHPAAAWDAAPQIIEDVMFTKAETEELEDGFDLDTIVLKPTQYARVMSYLINGGMLPREAANPINTGFFPNYLGLTWTTSMHSPVTAPLLVDREQLGGMADENIQSPGYTSGGEQGVEVKSIRDDDRDRYKVRARRVTVPVVLEPNAGVRITGTGI